MSFAGGGRAVGPALTFDPRYAAIFVEHDATGGLESIRPERDVSVHVYRNARSDIAVLFAGEHPDPIQRWLASAHASCRGSGFLSTVVATDTAGPPTDHVQLFRVALSVITPKLVHRVKSERLLCVVDPDHTELLILGAMSVSSALQRDFPHLDAPDAWSFSSVADGPITPPKPSRTGGRPPYDPIVAQAREVLGGTRQSLTDAIDEAVDLLDLAFGLPEPSDLENLRAYALSRFQRAEHRMHDATMEAMRELDAASLVADPYIAEVTELVQRLREYLPVGDPFATARRLADHAHPLALRAIRAVTVDGASRLMTTGPQPNLIPVLGSRLFVHDGLLPSSSLGGSSIGRAATRIDFPRKLALRAGSFPLLVAASVRASKSTEPAVTRILDDSEMMLVRAALEVPKVESPDERRAAASRLRTFLCDLVATAVCGPAYPLALARFTTGQMTGGRGPIAGLRHPGLVSRLNQCLGLLGRKRVDTHFASAWLDQPQVSINETLAELVDQLVSGSFGAAEVRLLPSIQSDLRAGRVVTAEPILTLNALWDAVARKSGYLNEPAVVTSLAQHPWRD